MRKLIIVLMMCLFFIGSLFAQDHENHDHNKPSIKYATNITAAVTFPLGLQLNITESIKIPVLYFDNPLMRGNNITIKAGAELTPITLEGTFNVIWTPVAFLELYVGVSAGSGWTVKYLHGLALNEYKDRKKRKTPVNFTKTFYSANCGGAFQFDLGAVIPHDWTHLVFRIDQFALYKGVSKITPYDSWIYKNDSGTNRNGFIYGAAYLAGYQMPIPLQLIALRVETEKTFFSVREGLDKSDWGEDRYKTVFGPILSFKALPIMDILLIAQWETAHVYLTPHKELFYQHTVIDKTKWDAIRFKRVGAIVSITLPHN